MALSSASIAEAELLTSISSAPLTSQVVAAGFPASTASSTSVAHEVRAATPKSGNGVNMDTKPATVPSSGPSGSEAASGDADAMDPGKFGTPAFQQYVDHTYTDYANVDEDELRVMKESGDAKGAPKALLRLNGCGAAGGVGLEGALGFVGGTKKDGRAGGNGRSSQNLPFPGKLLEVLDRGDLSAIIDWMPHGRAFIVKEPKIFTTQVLPRFFKQTKFLSFTRQLNLWGFKRITRGIDAGAYYHELFLPGRPNLAMRMRRQKIKGTGIRPIPNPEHEPNFYYNHPHVPKVERRGGAGPLPPLPGERTASLVTTGGDGCFARQTQAAMLGQGLVSQATPGFVDLAAGYPGAAVVPMAASINSMSEAAAAELRLRGSIMPSGFHSREFLPSLGLSATSAGPAIPKAELAHLKFMGAAAAKARASSRSFHPADSVQDDISAANRRLMERLLQGTSSAPVPSTKLHRTESQASLYTGVPGETFLGRNSLSMPASTTDGRGSSLFGGMDIGGYLPAPRQSFHSLQPSSRPSATQPSTLPTLAGDYDVASALRDARRLEEIARRTRALAGAYQDLIGGNSGAAGARIDRDSWIGGGRADSGPG